MGPLPYLRCLTREGISDGWRRYLKILTFSSPARSSCSGPHLPASTCRSLVPHWELDCCPSREDIKSPGRQSRVQPVSLSLQPAVTTMSCSVIYLWLYLLSNHMFLAYWSTWTLDSLFTDILLTCFELVIHFEILDDSGCLWLLSWFLIHNLPRSLILFLVFLALLLNPKPSLLPLVSPGCKQTMLL